MIKLDIAELCRCNLPPSPMLRPSKVFTGNISPLNLPRNPSFQSDFPIYGLMNIQGGESEFENRYFSSQENSTSSESSSFNTNEENHISLPHYEFTSIIFSKKIRRRKIQSCLELIKKTQKDWIQDRLSRSFEGFRGLAEKL